MDKNTTDLFKVKNLVFNLPSFVFGFSHDEKRTFTKVQDSKTMTLVQILEPVWRLLPVGGEAGFDLAAVRRRNKLIDVLEAANPDQDFELTKELYTEFKQVCNAYKADLPSKEIERFMSYIAEDLK